MHCRPKTHFCGTTFTVRGCNRNNKNAVNHPLAGVVEPHENSANEKIIEAAIENISAGEERGRGHDASREEI